MLKAFTEEYDETSIESELERWGPAAAEFINWQYEEQAAMWLEDARGIAWALGMFVSGVFEPVLNPGRPR